MLKRVTYFTTSLFVVIGMLGVATPALALVGTRHARGTVTAINRKTHVMTVKTTLGPKVNLKFGSTTTRLWHAGVRISLSRLHVGNRVDAAFLPRAGTTTAGTAGDVNDNNGLAEVEGTVAATDLTLNTVSIASSEGGSTVVLNVGASTVITRNDSPATLADLQFGDQVHAKYDSATMIASSIKAETDAEASEVEGTISAVDTTANTITIAAEGDGGDSEDGGSDVASLAPDVTLNVDSSTVIMLDDSPATLGSLQVGVKVEAQYDPSSMLASFVEAETE